MDYKEELKKTKKELTDKEFKTTLIHYGHHIPTERIFEHVNDKKIKYIY